MKNYRETNEKKQITPFENILGEKAYREYMQLFTRGMYALNSNNYLTKKEYGRLLFYIKSIDLFVKKFYKEEGEDSNLGKYLTGIDTSSGQQLPALRLYDLERFEIHKKILKKNRANQYIPNYPI